MLASGGGVCSLAACVSDLPLAERGGADRYAPGVSRPARLVLEGAPSPRLLFCHPPVPPAAPLCRRRGLAPEKKG